MNNKVKICNIQDYQLKDSHYEIFDADVSQELNKKFRSMNLKITLIATILFLLSLFIVVNAQTYKNKDTPVTEKLQPITLFTGQPTAWVNNLDFVYDGFYVQSADDRILVKFPPYMGIKIRAAIKLGNTVNVSGVLTTNLIGDKNMKLVKLTADKQEIYVVKTEKIIQEVKKEFVKNEGKVTELQIDKEGKINGYILEGKTIIRVPAATGEILRNIVLQGSVISYEGYKRMIAEGEVSSKLYDVVICTIITINGKEFLVK